ncbi:hypothetical protein IE53DRAFT_232939 [Violaceomyces palustris]|uniref:Uncharacterized protein n=1 Tax=Violaceomyces palustris TaxID=1673888 RepID=A0ACD0P4G6_9BASI|nr:hypothetical protein IE53DRAFT_232939 [Violaceomyces palustris]
MPRIIWFWPHTPTPLRQILKKDGKGHPDRSRRGTKVDFMKELLIKYKFVEPYLHDEYHEEGDGPTRKFMLQVLLPHNELLAKNKPYSYLCELAQANGFTASRNKRINKERCGPNWKEEKPAIRDEGAVAAIDERVARRKAFLLESERLRHQSTNIVRETRAGLVKYRGAASSRARRENSSTKATPPAVVPEPPKKPKVYNSREGKWIYNGKAHCSLISQELWRPSSIPVHVSRLGK